MKSTENHRHAYHLRHVALLLGLALPVFLSAPAQAGDVAVTNATAHVMEDAVNGRRIEVYMTIENTGAARDRLYAVRSKLSRNTMLSVVHQSGRSAHGDDGHAKPQRHMQTRVLDVAPGAKAELRHGGSHIMLMEPEETPAVGTTFPVTLFFERAGRIPVEVAVEQPEMAR